MAITDARAIKNVLYAQKYRVEFNNYPPTLVHKCSLPEREFEVSEYGGGGQTLAVKQAGGEKLSEFTLETIVPAYGEERLYWHNWQEQVRTHDTGSYYRDGSVTVLAMNDEPNMIWDIQDAWPSKVKFEDFDSEDGKKLVKISITMQCNDCIPRVR
jgi:phage tail-like protein